MSIEEVEGKPPENNAPTSNGPTQTDPRPTTPNDDDLTRDAVNKVIKFFKNTIIDVEEEYLGTDDYIRDIEIERANIRCITTSILTICGFLLPILFGIFYFIVKDSTTLHVKIHWLIILILIVSIFLVFVSIYYSVKGIRAPEPPQKFITKLDKHNYVHGRREKERISSENSIKALATSVGLVLLTFICIYVSIATTTGSTTINEIIKVTTPVINEESCFLLHSFGEFSRIASFIGPLISIFF